MTRAWQFRSLAMFCLLFLFTALASEAQITPLGDSYTSTTDSTTNYGAQKTLNVDAAKEVTYIQFNLASVPATASISQATLKLYVNTVTTAGSFNVDYVSASWEEGTIDASNAPPLGSAIASNISLTTADKNQYILINVTSAVQAWLSGSETNNGLALVANSSFNATFDSKENTTTSHPAELDIAFAGGDGTITGVTTASGSGLQGGGTSGTLNLSLTTACSSKQVLQWSGSAWACSNAGTGTITGVTAGTGLSGGGSSGSVTLANTGVLGVAAGTGITTTGGQTPTIANAGILALTQGTGLTITSGQTPTISINTSVVPELGTADAFTGNLSSNGELAAGGAPSGNVASGTIEVDASHLNNGSYGPGLLFAGGGEGIASNRNSGSNQYGLNFFTNYTARMQISNSGGVGIGMLPPSSGAQLGVNAATVDSYGAVMYGYSAPAGSNADGISGALLEGGNGDTTNGTPAGAGAQAVGGDGVQGGNGVEGYGSEGTVEGGDGLDGYGGNGQQLYGGNGVSGQGGTGPDGDGSGGNFTGGKSSADGDGIDAQAGSGYAGNFFGNVYVSGNLSAGSKNFKIDHPLDPANKYLVHASVESSEMMNIYTGNVVTDAQGDATVQLPGWFETLNTDFRYQLTVIGQFAQAIVASEIQNHQFSIRSSAPNVKVSWQVTGVRQDPYAKAHPMVVEEEKEPRLKGFYIHPELYGASPERQIEWARHPQMMNKRQQRAKPPQLPKPQQPTPARLATTAKR